MREHRRKYAMILAVCLFLMAFIPYLTRVQNNSDRTVASSSDDEEDIKTFNFEIAMEDGVFTVLDIVPYRGMGKLGYFVGGSEVVPIDYAITRTDMKDWLATSSTFWAAIKTHELISKDALTVNDDPDEWYISTSKKNTNGYFQVIDPLDSAYENKAKYKLLIDGEVYQYGKQSKVLKNTDSITDSNDTVKEDAAKKSDSLKKELSNENKEEASAEKASKAKKTTQNESSADANEQVEQEVQKTESVEIRSESQESEQSTGNEKTKESTETEEALSDNKSEKVLSEAEKTDKTTDASEKKESDSVVNSDKEDNMDTEDKLKTEDSPKTKNSSKTEDNPDTKDKLKKEDNSKTENNSKTDDNSKIENNSKMEEDSKSEDNSKAENSLKTENNTKIEVDSQIEDNSNKENNSIKEESLTEDNTKIENNTKKKSKSNEIQTANAVNYEFVQDDINGNYIWVDIYKWGMTTDIYSDYVWLYNYQLSVNKYEKLINDEIFKKEVLGLKGSEVDEVNVVVHTLEPHEVTVELMEKADFVKISANITNVAIEQMYYTYFEDYRDTQPELIDKYGTVKYGNVNYGSDKDMEKVLNFYKKFTVMNDYNSLVCNDIDWDVIVKLMERLALDKIPLIIDHEFLYTKGNSHIHPDFINDYLKELNDKDAHIGNSNNVFKLYAMLQYRPEFFYNLYMDPIDGSTPALSDAEDDKIYYSATGQRRTTGKFTHALVEDGNAKDGTIYWIYGTLLPAEWKYKEAGVPWKPWNELGMINANGSGGGIFDNLVIDNTNWDTSYEFTKDKGAGGTGIQDVKDYLGEEKSKDGISTSELFDYLINGVKRNARININLKVLQLQPSIAFKDSTYLKDVIKMALPRYNGTISLVNMTTAEFIGKRQDINSEYDMIYIGNELGKLPTSYNDTSLNGKIYLHVGDKVTGSASFNNIASIIEGGYRYSGNDITYKKLEDLESFLSAGLPVLTESDLGSLNKNKIDDSSNLYKFLRDNKVKKNLFDISELGQADIADELLRSIQTAKPDLTLVSNSLSYASDQDESPAYGNMVKDASNEKRVRLIVNFKGKNTEKYNLKYYYDENSNGIFEESEKVDSILDVKPNENINVNLTINKPAKPGIVQWKVKVESADNSNIRDEITGYTKVAYKNKETGLYRDGKQQIKILEIHSTGNDYNMSKHYNDQSSSFYRYIQEVIDYQFEFESITIDQFNKNINAENKTKAWNINALQKYDIVALSFKDDADYVSLASDKVTLLQNYVNNKENSLIYFHDSISHNNASMAKNNNTYYMNQYFRNRLGINRFNIATKEGTSGDSYSRDIATSPSDGSTNGNNYSQTQGYTYSELMQYAGNGNQIAPYSNLEMNLTPGAYASGYITNKISKLNDGQIANYPFKIGNNITVGSTHGQAYQLDLDNQNLIVWYTLSDDYNGNGSSAYYSTSPNDGRNNYYLYSNDNVVFSGVGHRESATEDETKLLINTLIAALLNAKEHNESKEEIEVPDIIIKNAEKISDEYYYYLDFDEINKDSSVETVKIIFQLGEDNNLTNGLWKSKFYFNESSKNTRNPVEETGIQVYRNSDNSLVEDNNVTTGIEYYFKCPVSKVKDNVMLPVDIALMEDGNEEPVAKQRVTVLYRPFFNLD